MAQRWTPDTWRGKPIVQVPEYPDGDALARVEERLRRYPPLVFAGEARRLKKHLAKVAEGGAFLLQGGDCAERFEECESGTIASSGRVWNGRSCRSVVSTAWIVPLPPLTATTSTS